MDTGEQLSKTILDFALKENEILTKVFNKGIFDMPELAFVYQIGKCISFLTNEHFDSKDYEWIREIDFGNGGPTDLAFISKDLQKTCYMLEFKLDNTYHAYSADIKKLHEPLNSKYQNRKWRKFFCSLKWVDSKNQGEGFLKILKNEFANKAKLVQVKCFSTIIGNRKKDNQCLYTFWEILNT